MFLPISPLSSSECLAFDTDDVKFKGLERAFGKLSLYQWFAGVHLKVCTSRLVGCLV